MKVFVAINKDRYFSEAVELLVVFILLFAYVEGNERVTQWWLLL